MRAREAAPSLRNCTRTEFSRLYDAAQHSGQWGSALTRRRWRRCQRGRRCPCRSRACAWCNFRRGVKLTQRRMEASGGSESPQRVEHSLLRNHSARAHPTRSADIAVRPELGGNSMEPNTCESCATALLAMQGIPPSLLLLAAAAARRRRLQCRATHCAAPRFQGPAGSARRCCPLVIVVLHVGCCYQPQQIAQH